VNSGKVLKRIAIVSAVLRESSDGKTLHIRGPQGLKHAIKWEGHILRLRRDANAYAFELARRVWGYGLYSHLRLIMGLSGVQAKLVVRIANRVRFMSKKNFDALCVSFMDGGARQRWIATSSHTCAKR
jgi:hypothetical protein